MEAYYDKVVAYRLRWLIAILVMLACALIAPAGFAQGPTAQDKENARTHMDVGDKLMAEGNLKAALEAHKAADAIMKVPSTGIEVAKVYVALGMLLEAKQKLWDIARIPLRTPEPAAFVAARKTAEAMREQIGARIPSIEVKITGLPDGVVATVTIDGVALKAEAVKLPYKVNPGNHTIEVSAPGYVSVTRKVDVKEGATHTESIELVAVVAPPPPKAKPIKAIAKPQPPSNGGETINEGGISPLVWVGVSVAGAGVILGAITGGLSLSKKGNIEETFNCNDSGCDLQGPNGEVLDDELSSANILANVSNVAFAVAGAGAVIGVIGLLLPSDSSSKKADHLAIYPTIGLNTMGIGAVGRF